MAATRGVERRRKVGADPAIERFVGAQMLADRVGTFLHEALQRRGLQEFDRDSNGVAQARKIDVSREVVIVNLRLDARIRSGESDLAETLGSLQSDTELQLTDGGDARSDIGGLPCDTGANLAIA